MKDFISMEAKNWDPAFDRIGKEWMLITAKGTDAAGEPRINTMTASWGGIGILFNRPVAFCFIRPQRYTYGLAEEASHLTLSFLPEEYREALRICGTESGRNMDKFERAGITPAETPAGVPFVKEAKTVVVGRKIYCGDLEKEGFIDESLLENFRKNDFHRMYILEIEEVLCRQ